MKSQAKSIREKTPTPARRSARRGRQSAARWRTPAVLSGGLLVAMVIVTYAPVVRDGFIWDDDFYVTENTTLRSLDGLRRMWLEPTSIPQYYPLIHTTFWLEYHLWGERAAGYHVVNVALHATSVLLFWRLLARLRVPGAWLAAALLAVHPVEVESVAWITERKNVLSLALALLSMLAYLRFAPAEEGEAGEATAPGRSRWYALAFALFTAALLSKTVVASVPAVLLVIYWWKRGRIGWRDVAPLVPFFVLGASLGLATVWLEKHHVGAEGEEWAFSPLERVLIAGRAVDFYAVKLFWPHPLMFFYPRWNIDAHDWRQYLAPVSVVVVVGGLWLARARVGRGPLAAVLIFAGVLAPALGFFNVYPFRYSLVADHFQYHASLALLALAAGGFALLAGRLHSDQQGIARASAAGVLIGLAVLSFRQTFVYENLETLYRDVIAKNPTSAAAYKNLCNYLDSLARYEDALALARDELTVLPHDPTPHSNVGRYLLKLGKRDGFRTGQMEESLGEFRTALDIDPDFSRHYNLGEALLAANQVDQAIDQFERALELKNDDARTMCGMGSALATSGKWPEARQWFERALAIDSDDAAAHYGLATALANEQRFDEAIGHLERALTIDPARADAHVALANLLLQRNQPRLAAQHYAAALDREPRNVEALHNIGVVFIDLGDPRRAVDYLQTARSLRPDDAGIRMNLGRAIEALRQRGK
jgi:tetratricopeptide (TPR) repeat protein